MSATGPTGSDDEREVLSSLPRSRRQRPTARREAARKKRTTAAGAKPAPAKKPAAKPKAATTAPKATARKKAAAKPKAAARPKAVAAVSAAPAKAKVRKPKRSVPPAGYATPRAKGDHGSADPGAAIASVVRSVLKLIPRP